MVMYGFRLLADQLFDCHPKPPFSVVGLQPEFLDSQR